ncbi:MAG TPA: type II toxin-antitoxin system RelE/ParE family toxin [Desulfosalsimonadaceae bacterium]|nr:type II toxin-antitoxin system RelE/ParE family toxin [Desulfosalsimonadaceae bacterium]
MKILQSRSFERKVKKFNKQEKKALDKQVTKISENSSIGTEKNGDLRGVFVHKFKMKTIQYLLAYRFVGDDLELITIGPHENYYRDLKSYLKSD